MWETLTQMLEQRGYPVLMQRRVVEIAHDGAKATHLVTDGPNGREKFEGTHFISSMPIRELVNAMNPPAPKEVRDAANNLRYRDFLIVSLVINREHIAPDNWIYVHEPGVKVGRIQNFKQWSPAMVPDQTKCCVGMEYFVFENDELWSSPDDKLVAMAKKEIAKLGLVKEEEIIDGTVVRMPKAYPMYDAGWFEQVQLIRNWIETCLPNLQLVGRNGMHKYNNQDHSMMTALFAARNIMGESHDLWAVNTDEEYHEEKQEESAAADAGQVKEPPRPAYAEPPRVDRSSKLAAAPQHASAQE
jgi:protoporphyrinogen oxidase